MSRKTLEIKENKKRKKIKIFLIVILLVTISIGGYICVKLSSDTYTKINEFGEKVTIKINKPVKKYYKSLSGDGILEEFIGASEDIEYMTNPKTMIFYAESGEDKADIVDGLVAECKEGVYYMSGLTGFINYLEQFPDMLKKYEPKNRPDLAKLNNDLIELYKEQINIFNKFAKLIDEAKEEGITKERKEEIYDKFVLLHNVNSLNYNNFNNWNNLLLINIEQEI